MYINDMDQVSLIIYRAKFVFLEKDMFVSHQVTPIGLYARA